MCSLFLLHFQALKWKFHSPETLAIIRLRFVTLRFSETLYGHFGNHQPLRQQTVNRSGEKQVQLLFL